MKIHEKQSDKPHIRCFVILDEPTFESAVVTLIHHLRDPVDPRWFIGLRSFTVGPHSVRDWKVSLQFHSNTAAEEFHLRQPEDEPNGNDSGDSR